MAINITKTQKTNTLLRYEQHILQSIIRSLPLHSCNVCLPDHVVSCKYDAIKSLLQEQVNRYQLKFRLSKKHIPILQELLSEIGVRLTSTPCRRHRVNYHVLNLDHNHYARGGKQL